MLFPQLCPLCEKANNCALTENSQTDSCWCQNTKFTDELLSKESVKTSKQRCICQKCAEKALRLSNAI